MNDTNVPATLAWPKIVILTALLIASFGCTVVATATEPTKATMIKLDSTHTAYVLTYKFGFLNRSLRLPDSALRATTLVATTALPQLTYSLRDKAGEAVTSGLTIAVILSSASSSNGTFIVQDGKTAEFDLLVVHQHLPADTATHFTVDTLQFILTNGPTSSLTRLHDANLALFTTKSITKSSYIRKPLK